MQLDLTYHCNVTSRARQTGRLASGSGEPATWNPSPALSTWKSVSTPLLLWRKEIPMCANTWSWLLSLVQLYSQSDVAGVNWSRRKGPTKMQQALNAGNVHSKRTVSKPLILLVMKASFVLLSDPRLWWWHVATRYGSWLFVTGNLLVVTFWRANYEFQAVDRITLEFSDRRAPILWS